MLKKDKSKHPPTAHTPDEDWGALFQKLAGVIDWALDIAERLSRDYEEDLASIERVRAFVHGWLDGRRAEVPLTDLLTTIGILFAAIEIDRGIDSVSWLAPFRTMLATPSALPPVLRCPGAARDGEATVRIRRRPRFRNASCGATTWIS